MEPQVLRQGSIKTRKPHRCFDCGAVIPPKTEVYSGTYKLDDVYTLYHHTDCLAASEYYRKFHGLKWYDFDDGIPPLFTMIDNAGEWAIDYNHLRGRFPHVVCRMELPKQKRGPTQ